jgi:hypothetical protein
MRGRRKRSWCRTRRTGSRITFRPIEDEITRETGAPMVSRMLESDSGARRASSPAPRWCALLLGLLATFCGKERDSLALGAQTLQWAPVREVAPGTVFFSSSCRTQSTREHGSTCGLASLSKMTGQAVGDRPRSRRVARRM